MAVTNLSAGSADAPGHWRADYRLKFSVLHCGLGGALVLLLAWHAAPLAGAREPIAAWTEVVPRAPTAGSPFTLQIHVQAAPQSEIRVLDPQWPAGIRYLSGPTLEGAGGDGETLLSYRLEARRTGDYLLYGFLVRIDSEALFTRSTPVRVLAGSARRPKATAEWVLSATSAVVGQAVALDLVLAQRDALRLPETVEVQAPRNAWFERYGGNAAIEFEEIDELRTYRVPVGNYLLTPTRPGPVTVPSARVVLAGADGEPVTVFSPPATVPVEPAPEAVGETGAIGRYQYDLEVVSEPSTAGDTLTVVMRIRGSGSLKFLQPPTLAAAGLPLPTIEQEDAIVASADGYRGMVTLTYRFVDVPAGRYRMAAADLPTYDPIGGVVRILPGVTREFLVAGDAAAEDRSPGRLPLAAGVESGTCGALGTQARSYLLLVPAPLLVVGWWLWRLAIPAGRGRLRTVVRGVVLLLITAALVVGAVVVALRPAPVERHFAARGLIEAGNAALVGGSFLSAEAAYLATVARDACPIIPWHNLAVAAEAVVDLPQAISWLRAIARYGLPEVDVRVWLEELEQAAGLTGQHRVAPFIEPDLPFIGLVIGFSLVVGALALLIRTRRAGPLIALVLLSIASGTMAILVIVSVRDGQQAIVVADDTTLKRVPLDVASDWVALEPGTTLALRGTHGEYDLVRTARGLDAWVRRGSTVVVPQARPAGGPQVVSARDR